MCYSCYSCYPPLTPYFNFHQPFLFLPLPSPLTNQPIADALYSTDDAALDAIVVGKTLPPFAFSLLNFLSKLQW